MLDGPLPVHCSFLNPAETFTSEKYAQHINEMHRKLQRLQSALVNRMGTVLLHDDARPHVVHTKELQLQICSVGTSRILEQF